MNGGSVITHEETEIKAGRIFPADIYPKFSTLNPEYPYTVSEYQMVSSVFDTMSHLMEQYFTGDDSNTTDYLIEALPLLSQKITAANSSPRNVQTSMIWQTAHQNDTISHSLAWMPITFKSTFLKLAFVSESHFDSEKLRLQYVASCLCCLYLVQQ